MQFLMLVCGEPEGTTTAVTEDDREAAPDVEQWWQSANDEGTYVMGERLRPATEAVTVRVRAGQVLRTDGPFAEVNEIVYGFDVLECDSMDEAVRIASGHPMAYAGVIEVRAMWPFDGGE
ncbi:YciI family protein [Terracoccus luteus]|jgi:hypothetical protein|uniref:YCII-related domain-containing protein n=1 Tax=Terracoccus luteus TaxID=53356 RepID=A0A495XVC1_9MICO|nr:YciI family protein [Terracoccus luteus]MBB2986706.1 hypothetical protein [Terracoccus luteus]MCP2172357.1 hypothetical protein [Terracoccus luteus]RKT76756.1 hypothetical protein DFJ68_0155 [Terracoccus luteus]